MVIWLLTKLLPMPDCRETRALATVGFLSGLCGGLLLSLRDGFTTHSIDSVREVLNSLILASHF